jgi:uncharacterized membrane protein YedE/YeeE
MLPGFPNAMPVEGLVGGLMIGLAAAIMLLGLGRIAGVSGLAARAVGITITGAPRSVASAFVIGLPVGAWLIVRFAGPVAVTFPGSIWLLVLGGLFVGFGTRLGSGCTSGHGVCGLSRLSPRSMLATAIFMGAGFMTVAAMRVAGIL